MAEALPEFISPGDMRALVPLLKGTAVLVTVGDRLYKRESDGWHLLDSEPRRIDGSA